MRIIEQITGRLRIDHPNDVFTRIFYEAVYQA